MSGEVRPQAETRRNWSNEGVPCGNELPAWSGDGGPRGEDRRRWQDEISSGFDRLVALASEVDRRKYSGDIQPDGYTR